MIIQAETRKIIVRVSVRSLGVVQGASSPILVKVGVPRLKILTVQRRGLPGTSGGLKFIHPQASESAEWIVNHNLGEKPIAEVRTASGAVVDADVLHVSNNQLRVYFSSAMAGEVRCL